MRFLAAAFVLVPLLLAGASPAAAGESTVNRDAYTQKARDDIQAWQSKLHEFRKEADAKGEEAGKATASELNLAWTKAAEASRRLQLMGADGWQNTKIRFEKAHHELTEAWRKAQSEVR